MKASIHIYPPLYICAVGQRKQNEDYIYPLPQQASIEDRLFIVADGMGGTPKGEVASRLVVETFVRQYQTQKMPTINQPFLSKSIQAMQSELDDYIQLHPASSNLGSTIAVLQLHAKGASIAHIGDSRVYHIRGEKVLFKTKDHSLVNELVDQQVITEEEAVHHPKRHILTQAIQGGAQQKPVFSQHHIKENILAGDYFFLCSDGIFGGLSEDDLLKLLSDASKKDEYKMQQIKAICQQHSSDNYSAYLIKIKRGMPTSIFSIFNPLLR
ncbi:MAG: PP2C family serine/threonine-protein phosphatase [Bacteroidota bacterium]